MTGPGMGSQKAESAADRASAAQKNSFILILLVFGSWLDGTGRAVALSPSAYSPVVRLGV